MSSFAALVPPVCGRPLELRGWRLNRQGRRPRQRDLRLGRRRVCVTLCNPKALARTAHNTPMPANRYAPRRRWHQKEGAGSARRPPTLNRPVNLSCRQPRAKARR